MSVLGPPPGLSSNIPPSDAMNIDLPPQSERAMLPSLGILPTPVLPPPAPTGFPTQQSTDTQLKALGPDSEFWKTVLTLEALTFWSGHANLQQPGYPRPLNFETRMNQLIKYFAHFVSLSWDFGDPRLGRRSHDADAAYAVFGTSSIQPGDIFFEDRTNIKDHPADKEEEQDQLEEDSMSQGPRCSSPVASCPKPSTPQDHSSCEFPVLGFDDLYPPQEWVYIEDIHGHHYCNYAHFALLPSKLKEEIANSKAHGDTYKTINGCLMILMNPNFKHQVSCIGQDGTSCGCCLSVGLNCPNLTYRPPSVGANPQTLFIPSGWDWELPVKPKFGPPSKASKTPASSKTVAPKSIQEEKVGPPSRVSKFSATEVDESDVDEVVFVDTSALKPPRKRQVVPLPKASTTAPYSKSFATVSHSTSDKVPLRNAKFFQHRSSSKHAPPDLEAEAMPHSSIIEAVVMEFGPSIVIGHVEHYVKRAQTSESESEQGA
ncbi:hypothetical protein EDD85DRAFT_795598 [Armillaria nabsnona]|nr:hypothetical protein EDD85DRAFT_795598 [Armillaria nabsnona]